VLSGPPSRHVRRHGQAVARPPARRQFLGWFTRHTVLTVWLVLGLTIAIVAYVRGQSPLGALAIGAALGALLVLLPLMFDPTPAPERTSCSLSPPPRSAPTSSCYSCYS